MILNLRLCAFSKCNPELLINANLKVARSAPVECMAD